MGIPGDLRFELRGFALGAATSPKMGSNRLRLNFRAVVVAKAICS